MCSSKTKKNFFSLKWELVFNQLKIFSELGPRVARDDMHLQAFPLQRETTPADAVRAGQQRHSLLSDHQTPVRTQGELSGPADIKLRSVG